MESTSARAILDFRVAGGVVMNGEAGGRGASALFAGRPVDEGDAQYDPVEYLFRFRSISSVVECSNEERALLATVLLPWVGDIEEVAGGVTIEDAFPDGSASSLGARIGPVRGVTHAFSSSVPTARALTGAAVERSGGGLFVEAEVVRVVIESSDVVVPADTGAVSADEERGLVAEEVDTADGWLFDLQDFDTAARQLGAHLMGQVYAWLRGKGQYWLGMSGERPQLLDPVGVYFLEDGEWKQGGISYSVDILGASRIQAAIDATDLASELETWMAREAPVPIERQVLADAYHQAMKASSEAWAMAAILGAVALEIGIKRAVRERATTAQRGLVEFILENHRSVEVAAESHFSSLLAALGSKSLREDRRDVWLSVRTLFQLRNRAVHAGEWPSEDVIPLLNAASDALSWLDS